MLYERKFTGWIGYGLYEWRMAQKSFLFKVWFWPLGLCTFKFPFQWEMKEYINWLLLFHTNLLAYAIFHTPTLLAFFIAVMIEGDIAEPCTSLQHGQHRELEMRESSLQEFSFIDDSHVCNTIISDAGTQLAGIKIQGFSLQKSRFRDSACRNWSCGLVAGFFLDACSRPLPSLREPLVTTNYFSVSISLYMRFASRPQPMTHEYSLF